MATTVNADAVNAYTAYALAKKEVRKQKLLDDKARGLFAFTTTAEVPTTSLDTQNDEYFFFTFPAQTNCYLVALEVTTDDLDAHATPALVFDVNIENAAGTEVTLINNTTIGQGGGSDLLDADGGHILRDVTGQKLGIKIVTIAATAAEGTVTLKGLFWAGDPISIV